MRHLLASVLGLTLVLLISACSASGAARITIGAASDLAPVLDVLSPEITAACAVEVVTVLGSSGQLRDQVRSGAPYDIYLSADRAFPHALEAQGHMEDGGVRDYGVGRIVLVWREGEEPLDAIEGLRRTGLRWIAIANPDHAPYGRAAREALESAGLWDELTGRFVTAENIRQAAEYVRTGDADAGIVALSLVVQAGRPFTLLDSSLHHPIVQSGGVTTYAENPRGARCAMDVIAGESARPIFERFGFEAVPE